MGNDSEGEQRLPQLSTPNRMRGASNAPSSALPVAEHLADHRQVQAQCERTRPVTVTQTVRLLDEELPHPLLLAPVSQQRLVHPIGEVETARGADAADACMVVSTHASTDLYELARDADGRRWFQLYFQPQQAATETLLQRAESAGYSAIVVTLDVALQAPSLQALRAGFRMPAHLRGVNVDAPGDVRGPFTAPGECGIFQSYMRQSHTQAALRGIGDIEESAQRLVESVLAAGGNLFPRDLHDEAIVPLIATNEAPRGARPIDIAEIDTTVGGDTGSDSERVIDLMWFTRAWLEQRRIEPGGCAIMRISGDSMEPTLPDGSSILVDRNRRDRIDFRVYVVRIGAGLMVKRAVEQRGEWLLASDNPEVAPLRWPADAEIVGEVVWVARTLLDSASHIKHKPRLDFSRWSEEPRCRTRRSEVPERRKLGGRSDS